MPRDKNGTYLRSIGVDIRPLIKHKDTSVMIKELYQLALSVGVKRSELRDAIYCKFQGIATVFLESMECEDYLMAISEDLQFVENRYKLTRITEKPDMLIVTRLSTQGRRSSSFPACILAEPLRLRIQIKALKLLYEALPSHHDGDDTMEALNISNFVDVQISKDLGDPSTPGQRVPSPPESQTTPPVENSPQEVIKLDVETSTPSMLPCGCPETVFYHLDQYIGVETRHTEFKRGGVWKNPRKFCEMVGKYVCGFLNSEGGTIFFGVTDDGRVRGIQMDAQREHELRSDVDFAVESMLEPRVDPSEYSVNFARVMEDNGQLSRELRVMEVCVKPRRPSRDIRYKCANVVYLKRDGGVQTIQKR